MSYTNTLTLPFNAISNSVVNGRRKEVKDGWKKCIHFYVALTLNLLSINQNSKVTSPGFQWYRNIIRFSC